MYQKDLMFYKILKNKIKIKKIIKHFLVYQLIFYFHIIMFNNININFYKINNIFIILNYFFINKITKNISILNIINYLILK